LNSASEHNYAMLSAVAEGLGDELLKEVAFVGGSTTWLLCTDDIVLDDIRSTDDVDLVIELGGIADWERLTERLAIQGFKITAERSDVTCRFVFNDVTVDVMPSVEAVLGYENRWFVDGLANADIVTLPSGIAIKIFKPAYFVATKLEAFKGRGNGDAFHKDVEDIVLVVDGRERLLEEVAQADHVLRTYIASGIAALLGIASFEYVIESLHSVRANPGRGKLIHDRLKQLSNVA
jgi:predicted nucleotidyltransferase